MKQFPLPFICIAICWLVGCKNNTTLFEKIPSSHSGISFNNNIMENDSINPMDAVNAYNGGGVGIGDFNNDGLQDIYFTGNMLSSKLYLNKGDFKFEDITEKAGVDGLGRWARGVAVVDINNDGLADLYVCNTVYGNAEKRTNILYVNEGADKDGIPHFKDMAAEYELNINVFSTMANFFDYDNDGDLDMYLTVNGARSENENQFGKGVTTKESSKGVLYRNDWDSLQNHPIFHDVSVEAGIIYEGIGHAASTVDINQDGWKDIFISDDFLSDDILYINNKNGTFTNRGKEYFKHTSFNSMGQDIIDINNDGLPDLVELDMNPKDNYRKKMMLPPNNYNTVKNFETYGNQYQYVRNTLQLNQGPTLFENDSVGSPVFSEIGFMSNIAQTDWSWTPLLMDYDNDGYRDMIVTNGFPRDITDRDFIAYRKKAVSGETPMQLLTKIPEVKLANYAFKNTDGITFTDVTTNWGLTTPSFSNGAAYADLDNDGDMDLIVNNIKDEAFVYKNNSYRKGDSTAHFFQVKCIGDKKNIAGIGTCIDIFYAGGKHQIFEYSPYRGYLSTNQNIAQFGLGKTTKIDSVVVRWPGTVKQTITNVKADQLLTVNIANAKETYVWEPTKLTVPPLFKEVTKAKGIDYINREIDFNDFNIQTNLPHKLSEYSPALAAGDIDGNGLDDVVIGGNPFAPTKVLLQQQDGKFTSKNLMGDKELAVNYSKDGGLLLFDANGDGSLDLYIAGAGYKDERSTINYQDKLFINDGKGNYKLDSLALPTNYTSKLCVRAMDYNKDGKLDIFVSGRVDPGNYPKPVGSFIYRNDSKDGKTKFSDVTLEVAPDLKNIGLVCDALFSDFDDDGQTDLILAGEWMPVTFLKNVNGKFTNVTKSTGINGQLGWWNSITAGDFRHTGRTDYIVGNVGLNTLFKASEEHPVYITAKDFNNNGSYQAIPSLFLPDQKGQLQEFPAHGRDDLTDRMPILKKRFNNYSNFATATMNEVLTDEQRKGALRLKATNLQSCYIRNDGGGKFTMIPLPKMAQTAPLNGMAVDDYDNDGNLDVLINGNDFGTDVSIGRYDAMNGLLLKGDGKGSFKPLSILESGIYIPGNGKALVKLAGKDGKYLMAASQNRDALKVFELRNNPKTVRVEPTDILGLITNSDDTKEKVEFYFGSSFLSQSARFIAIHKKAKSITIINYKGEKRTINF